MKNNHRVTSFKIQKRHKISQNSINVKTKASFTHILKREILSKLCR